MKVLPRGLTAHETAILAAIIAGKSNAEIAREAGRSEATVKSQVTSIMLKLNAWNRTEAAVIGLQLGLGTLPLAGGMIRCTNCGELLTLRVVDRVEAHAAAHEITP